VGLRVASVLDGWCTDHGPFLPHMHAPTNYPSPKPLFTSLSHGCCGILEALPYLFQMNSLGSVEKCFAADGGFAPWGGLRTCMCSAIVAVVIREALQRHASVPVSAGVRCWPGLDVQVPVTLMFKWIGAPVGLWWGQSSWWCV